MELLKWFDIVAIQERWGTVVVDCTEAKLEALTEVDWRYKVSKSVDRGVRERYTYTPILVGTSVAIGLWR